MNQATLKKIIFTTGIILTIVTVYYQGFDPFGNFYSKNGVAGGFSVDKLTGAITILTPSFIALLIYYRSKITDVLLPWYCILAFIWISSWLAAYVTD